MVLPDKQEQNQLSCLVPTNQELILGDGGKRLLDLNTLHRPVNNFLSCLVVFYYTFLGKQDRGSDRSSGHSAEGLKGVLESWAH